MLPCPQIPGCFHDSYGCNLGFLPAIALRKITVVRNIYGEVFRFDELADDSIYTVALPEKCLNGQRMGLVIEDYDIVDQRYLVPILKEYLRSNPEINVNDQLENLRLNVY